MSTLGRGGIENLFDEAITEIQNVNAPKEYKDILNAIKTETLKELNNPTPKLIDISKAINESINAISSLIDSFIHFHTFLVEMHATFN